METQLLAFNKQLGNIKNKEKIRITNKMTVII